MDATINQSTDTKINFEIEGPGVMAAVSNGDVSSSEPYQAMSRWTYKGKCVAIIKASANEAKITIKPAAKI